MNSCISVIEPYEIKLQTAHCQITEKPFNRLSYTGDIYESFVGGLSKDSVFYGLLLLGSQFPTVSEATWYCVAVQ